MHSRRSSLTALLAFTLLALPGHAHADITGSGAAVEITSPSDGATLDITPFNVVVSVAEDALALARVELRVDGTTVASLPEGSSWTFVDVQLDEGMHELVAVAIEVDDIETASEPVTVAVVAGGASEETSKGCAVTSAGGGLAGLALTGVALLGLARARRRR